MRPIILFVVAGWSVLTGVGWLGTQTLAAEDSKDLPALSAVPITGQAGAPQAEHSSAAQAGITRVAIAISGGPVAYTDQLRENPPAIVIEFRSRNVKAQLEPLVAVNSGLIKEIQSDYYPPGLSAVPGTAQAGRRALKSLTLTLVQPAAYTIAQQANQIVVSIETPPGLLPGRMAIGGLTILDVEARETLISRLKVMGAALQQAAPPVTAESVKPKPVVVTKPVQIPQPVVQPAPAPIPVSGKGVGGFWYGVLFGIGASGVAVVGWRRRRRATLTQEKRSTIPSESPPIAQGASVLEQLVLKAMQHQGQKVVSSKAITGLGTLWIIEKDEHRQGLVCLADGGFFERKVLEQFVDALQQEALRSGTVYALGAFTAPAQSFAKENEITLIPQEEVFKLMEVELKSAALVIEEETLNQQLAKPQGELVQAQERIKALEQELSAQKKRWEESERCLGEERTKKGTLEQQVAELTRELAQKVELTAKLSQELDQLNAKSAEVDQRLATEQEKRTQLEAQIAKLEEQMEIQAAARAEKEELVQEVAAVTKEVVKVVAADEPKVAREVSQGREHRKWPRLDLSRHKGKGVLVRATSNDGEPMNGDARNISAGGLCIELPSGERLADEFELKLFFPDRTKPIEAIGKLVWKGRGSRRRMERRGVAFSAVNAPDQEAISQFVEQRKPEPAPVG